MVAPSGPVPAERFDRGLRVLRRHLEADVVLADNIHEQQGYFAGPDDLRFSPEEVLERVAEHGDLAADLLLDDRPPLPEAPLG